MVVLSLPGSGGRFGSDLPPGFFRGMHTWLPNGLGTDLIRGLEYFGRAANTWERPDDRADGRAEDRAATSASTS